MGFENQSIGLHVHFYKKTVPDFVTICGHTVFKLVSFHAQILILPFVTLFFNCQSHNVKYIPNCGL